MDKFEEVREYRKLCDEGIITQEEFLDIKDKLLGLGDYLENDQSGVNIEKQNTVAHSEPLALEEMDYEVFPCGLSQKTRGELIAQAIIKGKEEDAILLMSSKCNSNFEYKTNNEFGDNSIPLLYLAAEAGFIKLTELLIAEGADVNAIATISTENGIVKRPILYGVIVGGCD